MDFQCLSKEFSNHFALWEKDPCHTNIHAKSLFSMWVFSTIFIHPSTNSTHQAVRLQSAHEALSLIPQNLQTKILHRLQNGRLSLRVISGSVSLKFCCYCFFERVPNMPSTSGSNLFAITFAPKGER